MMSTHTQHPETNTGHLEGKEDLVTYGKGLKWTKREREREQAMNKMISTKTIKSVFMYR